MLEGVKDIGAEWYVDPARREEFHETLMRNGRVSDFISEVYRHKTRERIWVSESARLVRDRETGKALYYEGSVREVTETIRRLQLEERFRKLTSEVPGALFQAVSRGHQETAITYLSPGFTRITGVPEAEAKANAQMVLRRIHPDDRRAYLDSAAQALEAMGPWDNEHRFQMPDGTEKWLRVSATPELTGDAITWHGYLSDISAKKLNEVAIQQLAYYDVLTGLPNRRLFLDRMRRGHQGVPAGAVTVAPCCSSTSTISRR